MTRLSDTRPHWSASMRDYDCLSVRSGVLRIESVSTVDLAEQLGTPLFVSSESQIRVCWSTVIRRS